MYTRSEGFFKGHHDIRLFFQVWKNPDAKGTILITHGHGEHSESYHRLVQNFEGDQWSFWAWDLRGHGRSEGRRGFASEFDDYCKDFRIFLDLARSDAQVKKGPLVLFCHSMGGLIQLKSMLADHDIIVDAIIVSAPLLGLSLPVPFIKAKGASILNSLIPQITLGNEITNDMLTRDVDVIREYEHDALRHTRMSPGVFLGILESWDYVHLRAAELKIPALFLLPEEDPVTSTPQSKIFFEKMMSSNKEIYIYPEAKHELINETIRKTVFADIKNFLDNLLEQKK